MPSLEDVRRYALQYAYEGPEKLQARVAKELGMSLEDAAKIVRDLGNDPDGVPVDTDAPLPNIGLAAGLGVAGGTLTGAPAAAVIAAEELAQTNDSTRPATEIESD